MGSEVGSTDVIGRMCAAVCTQKNESVSEIVSERQCSLSVEVLLSSPLTAV